MLVGRERELLLLNEAIAAAGAGRSVVVMLSGEPGIGKTRLLEELATRAREAGAVAAWGRTWEVGLTPPFWPWLEILHALETDSDRAPRLGGLDQPADATTRLVLFDEIARFLGRRTASGPLALLIDDLHAADLSTLQLLDYLVARVEHTVFGLATRD
ncbi:MAG: ATP-binding protein, partial [Solirubrobacteraceae bacterium]